MFLKEFPQRDQIMYVEIINEQNIFTMLEPSTVGHKNARN
jgi:hypothetical protein